MHRFDTFTDLRTNRDNRNGEIILWPSFTDIMTVVLMIFMLTMVVVIIKNTTLAQSLLRSEEKNSEIEELLKRTEAAGANLKITLADLEEKLRQKEMQIILLSDEVKALLKDMEGKTTIITAVESELADLKNRIVILQETAQKAETEMARARESEARAAAAFEKQAAELTRQYDLRIAEIQLASEKKLAEQTEAKTKEIEEYNRKVLALLSQLKDKESVILSLGDQKQALELSLAKQRQDFSALEEKYIRLIRPARSPSGKKVVTVTFQRLEGHYHIAFKNVDSEKVETLTLDQLHRQLVILKQKWQNQLYVRIVIPENSGLTYNEAWTFTKDVLSRYDYYYRDEIQEKRVDPG
ncbi:MAG: hypothetical protein AB7S77_21090 [Desulfatirhabdiaceae bacterium]